MLWDGASTYSSRTQARRAALYRANSQDLEVVHDRDRTNRLATAQVNQATRTQGQPAQQTVVICMHQHRQEHLM